MSCQVVTPTHGKMKEKNTRLFCCPPKTKREERGSNFCFLQLTGEGKKNPNKTTAKKIRASACNCLYGRRGWFTDTCRLVNRSLVPSASPNLIGHEHRLYKSFCFPTLHRNLPCQRVVCQRYTCPLRAPSTGRRKI